uniref:CCHC-type domain-containing protein n=1 Tax=Vitis vinifera TaxID=29760 RepID=F6HXW6_VITVI
MTAGGCPKRNDNRGLTTMKSARDIMNPKRGECPSRKSAKGGMPQYDDSQRSRNRSSGEEVHKSSIFLQSRGARAMQILPERVRKLWNEWELRLIVPLSLFLEIVLIIFSNRRKYTATPWIRILIWSAYMCADWVATLSLGTLANSQGDSKGKLLDPNYTLMAFWAPFLLLHLGGPDTVAAYSIEENELWLRHLLGLVVQAGVAFYVFLRSWAGTPLTFLSIPMFVAGIIKYGERTWVLRFASKNHVRDSLLPGPDYADFLKGCSSRKDERQVNTITKVEIEIPGGKYLHIAYFLFKQQLSHLYADLILSPDDQKTSEGIIRCMSFEEAFKVVEMELSFLYDALYTKATVAYSLLGIILRTASFLSTISTLAAFCFFIDRHEFSNIDLNITYALLFGAIFLEIYSIIMLILSDWRIVWLSSKSNSLADSICRAIASFQSVVTSDQRWSRRMAQNNLIDSCLRDKTKFNPVPRFFDMNKFLERYWYMTWEKVDDMKKPIFCWLLEMTNDAGDRRQLLKHREAFQVGAIVAKLPSSWKGYRKRILHKSEDYSLEEIQKHLLIEEESRSRDKMVEESNGGTNKANAVSKANHPRGKNNKRNSGNYMSPKKNQEQFKGKKGPCFVCGKPRHYARECRYRKDQKGAVVNAIDEEIIATLSDVCVVQGKVQGWWYDTCATIHVTYDKSLFKTFEDAKGDQEVQMGNEGRSKVLGKGTIEVVFTSGKKVTLINVLYVPDMKKNLVSGDLLGKSGIKAVFESVEPRDAKEDKSKSVLFEACRLAKMLESLEIDAAGEKWEMISGVWMEMLCYAASHCGWIQHRQLLHHRQQLRRGGELLTHVCLLMSHLGLTE